MEQVGEVNAADPEYILNDDLRLHQGQAGEDHHGHQDIHDQQVTHLLHGIELPLF